MKIRLRFAVESIGRFQSVEVNKWLGTHSINVPDMGKMDDAGAREVFDKK